VADPKRPHVGRRDRSKQSLPPEKQPKDVQGLAQMLVRAGKLTKQFVDGKDLAAIVEEKGPLPIALAVDYSSRRPAGCNTPTNKEITFSRK
jgi:hypothetical protein